MQVQVEIAEAEAEAEENFLAQERQSLIQAKQQLESSLVRWKEITTQESSITSTENLIAEKKNELVHTKVILSEFASFVVNGLMELFILFSVPSRCSTFEAVWSTKHNIPN